MVAGAFFHRCGASWLMVETNRSSGAAAASGWVAAAAVVGGLASWLFADVLALRRPLFILPYAVLALAFVALFGRQTGIVWRRQFTERWLLGLAVGAAASAFVVWNVRVQPSSPTAEGAALVLSLIWEGVTYGAVDALLLTVVPVLAVLRAVQGEGRAHAAAVALISLGASAIVTLAYHWGFPEFRGLRVLAPLLGNAVITLAYLLSRNALAPVLSHVAMHVAAVLHGPASVLQLPPHG